MGRPASIKHLPENSDSEMGSKIPHPLPIQSPHSYSQGRFLNPTQVSNIVTPCRWHPWLLSLPPVLTSRNPGSPWTARMIIDGNPTSSITLASPSSWPRCRAVPGKEESGWPASLRKGSPTHSGTSRESLWIEPALPLAWLRMLLNKSLQSHKAICLELQGTA